ncbi:hypothetical protein TRFO_27705 [Tritrichomonas foetus]|uniref:Uncharacterized protein n=1 Tax=Tritrichomonas foetus TaxID=1144522 RepID=A0A1J4JZV8_9EUKA|nr:hypothetical protein TRFO_27705 [Tritrichomonas foetus]|eukprot:OHT04703.1 hypothetical protein TRFO_27705 [Tritrichomonas foetus]
MIGEENCNIAVLHCTDSRSNSRLYSLRDLSAIKRAGGKPGTENVTKKKTGSNKRKSLNEKYHLNDFGFNIDDIDYANGEDEFGRRKRRRRSNQPHRNADGEYEYYSDDDDDDFAREPIRKLTVEELQNSVLRGLSPELLEKYNKELQALTALEKETLNKWLSAIKNLILPFETVQNFSYLDEMEEFAESLLNELKTPVSTLADAIVGPRYSGKTSFLAVFLTKIAERYVQNGQWKKTFIFYLDFNKVQSGNLLEFYQYIVDLTFSQIELQDSTISQYCPRIVKFFKELPTGKVAPVFPKRIAIDKDIPGADSKFTRLAQDIFTKFHDHTAFLKTFDMILTFPHEVGKIMELPNVHFVIDHFEKSDVTITPTDFYDPKTKPVSVLSRLKNTLITQSFVICCQDEPSFLKVLQGIKNSSPEMTTKVIISNISDIPIEKIEAKQQVIVNYKDGHSCIVLTREKCHGCIAFLVKWEQLMKLGKTVAEERSLMSKAAARYKQETSATRADMALIDYVRDFLPHVLSIKDIPSSEIRDVNVVDQEQEK